ncbi:MAG: hypothetical protein QW728_07360, partial [Thermoplasmata archaeon]
MEGNGFSGVAKEDARGETADMLGTEKTLGLRAEQQCEEKQALEKENREAQTAGPSTTSSLL